MWSPQRLYVLCLEMLIPLSEKAGENYEWDDPKQKAGPLDKLAARFAEDLLLQAHQKASRNRTAGYWSEEWKVFLTPKVQNVVLSWDKNLLRLVSSRCQNIKQILVSKWKTFSPSSLSWLPKTAQCLDFDGELFYRGQQGPNLDFSKPVKYRGWLQEAEILMKALHIWHQKAVEPIRTTTGLTELHLGTVQVTASDLRTVLQAVPNLKLLRHYQLVTALNELHGEQWRNKEQLPKYRLRNLDMDFSHVVRCRMSPEAVLPPDVLQLAVLLCPDATQVRVRFDCSTPHDVLSPLATMLRSLRELSLVCVTSGERSRLDFTDITPILEQHGSESLRSLELKVIEEVDVHVITTTCPKLERLVLSGCGNVMPPTCPHYNCGSQGGRSRSNARLKRLKLLFFADGDDFSWDHDVPQCFWHATLGSARNPRDSGQMSMEAMLLNLLDQYITDSWVLASEESLALISTGRKDSSHGSRLEGIFLESPRISPSTADEIFFKVNKEKTRSIPFPELQVLSLCRYPELTMEHVTAICGLDHPKNKSSLRYIRLSDCEKIGPRQERQLTTMIKIAYPTESVQLVVK